MARVEEEIRDRTGHEDGRPGEDGQPVSRARRLWGWLGRFAYDVALRGNVRGWGSVFQIVATLLVLDLAWSWWTDTDVLFGRIMSLSIGMWIGAKVAHADRDD